MAVDVACGKMVPGYHSIMNENDKVVSDVPHVNRRSIVAALATGAIGSLVALFPVLAGLGVVFDPLRRRHRAEAGDGDSAVGDGFVRVCALDAVPADGVPHAFPVTTTVADAWSRTPEQRVGMVYLRRIDEAAAPKIIAFTAECPHLGCSVDFNGQNNVFECPCHVSAFALDGAKEAGPSLRGLDSLPVKVAEPNGKPEIWVHFQRFQTGIAERVPIG